MKPSLPAPVALKAGPPDKAAKQLRITDKVRKACELLASGKAKTQTEAAEQVGMARESLGRALAKPHFVEHMHQRAVRTIQMAAARASEVKVELMDCGDSIARDRASSFVLGTAGIGPAAGPSLNLNIEIKAGYVIDLTDEPQPAPRAINP
jgi:hypothetical protein